MGFVPTSNSYPKVLLCMCVSFLSRKFSNSACVLNTSSVVKQCKSDSVTVAASWLALTKYQMPCHHAWCPPDQLKTILYENFVFSNSNRKLFGAFQYANMVSPSNKYSWCYTIPNISLLWMSGICAIRDVRHITVWCWRLLCILMTHMLKIPVMYSVEDVC